VPDAKLLLELGDVLPKGLEPHPLALRFRPFTDDEFKGLVDDIRANGQHHSITLLDGQLLDGVHRYKACRKAGIQPRGKPFTGSNPAAFVCSVNLHRRHLELTAEEKRALIAEVLAESPDLSDRQIGELAKADHKTVAKVRAGKVARGEIPTSPTRTDTTGRRQPSKKSRKGRVQTVGTPSGPTPPKARDTFRTEPEPEAKPQADHNHGEPASAAVEFARLVIEHISQNLPEHVPARATDLTVTIPAVDVAEFLRLARRAEFELRLVPDTGAKVH
jgi:hypothetical protein